MKSKKNVIVAVTSLIIYHAALLSEDQQNNGGWIQNLTQETVWVNMKGVVAQVEPGKVKVFPTVCPEGYEVKVWVSDKQIGLQEKGQFYDRDQDTNGCHQGQYRCNGSICGCVGFWIMRKSGEFFHNPAWHNCDANNNCQECPNTHVISGCKGQFVVTHNTPRVVNKTVLLKGGEKRQMDVYVHTGNQSSKLISGGLDEQAISPAYHPIQTTGVSGTNSCRPQSWYNK